MTYIHHPKPPNAGHICRAFGLDIPRSRILQVAKRWGMRGLREDPSHGTLSQKNQKDIDEFEAFYLGWRPSLLGWRPLLLGWRRPSLLGLAEPSSLSDPSPTSLDSDSANTLGSSASLAPEEQTQKTASTDGRIGSGLGRHSCGLFSGRCSRKVCRFKCRRIPKQGQRGVRLF